MRRTLGDVHVERKAPAQLGGEGLDLAIVIDVFRATSTAAVLMSRGVASLPVIAHAEDLDALPPPATGPYLVFSELSNPISLDRVDNSPVIASQVSLANRTPVLLTTNGTRATCAAVASAKVVLLASFLNIRRVVDYVHRARPSRVTLIPAGDIKRGETHIEDERCADAIALLLRGESPDFDRLAAECLAEPRVQRRVAKSAELADDIRLALTPDRHAAVIRVHAGPSANVCIASSGAAAAS